MVEVKDFYHDSVDLRIVEAKQQLGRFPNLYASYATFDNFFVREAYYRDTFKNFLGFTAKEVIEHDPYYKGCKMIVNNNIPFGTMIIGLY